jgi:hypothetical protein
MIVFFIPVDLNWLLLGSLFFTLTKWQQIKIVNFKVRWSICTSKPKRHLSVTDIEYSGESAATSSACELERAQTLHCYLRVYSFPTLQCVYISVWVSTEFYYTSNVCIWYRQISLSLWSLSGLENREYGRRNSSRWPRDTLYPQKVALTSPTGGDRSVGIVRSRTQATELFDRFTMKVN